MKDFKTFDDLVFKRHELAIDNNDKRAKLFFNNNYGVSVATGSRFFTNKNNPYELAVLYKDESNHVIISYDNEVANGGVIGWCDSEKVTELMIKIQQFKK